MVLREKPVALATSDCPPRPIALASLAAHRRRVRSFNTGDKATNFSRRTASMLGCCMVQKYSGFRIVRLIYGHSLSPFPVVQVRGVKSMTQLLLCVRAGGRCEFDGCNKYL